jgi:hypothetical protein
MQLNIVRSPRVHADRVPVQNESRTQTENDFVLPHSTNSRRRRTGRKRVRKKFRRDAAATADGHCRQGSRHVGPRHRDVAPTGNFGDVVPNPPRLRVPEVAGHRQPVFRSEEGPEDLGFNLIKLYFVNVVAVEIS